MSSAAISMRAYLSSHHLFAASHFAQLASTREAEENMVHSFDVRHRAYVMGAVLESVAFLESLINELLQDAADDHPGYLGSLDQGIRKGLGAFWEETDDGNVKCLVKYQATLALSHKELFDRGAAPYQEAALLTKLRNLLVHFRPETVGTANVQKLQTQIQSKFQPNLLLQGAGNPFFPDKCLGAGCANWAVRTVRQFADSFCERMGLTVNYQRVDWSTNP